MHSRIKLGYLGVGRYLPPHTLKNEHLERMVDTSDEWIVQRTGIRERRVIGSEDTLISVATKAARAALDDAGLDPSALSILQVGVNTHLRFPSCAAMVEQCLDVRDIPAADITAGCAGFIFAVEAVYNRLMSDYFTTGKAGYGLAIGVDCLSQVTDWNDRSTCVLFGDGAGAVVIGPVRSGEILAIYTRTHGRHTELLYLDEFLDVPLEDPRAMLMKRRNGTVYPYLRMEGRKVFVVAVRSMMADIRAVIEKYNRTGDEKLTLGDIDYVIPHQANLRIVAAVQEGLKLSVDQVYRDGVIKYGNTSAASIPIGYVDQWDKRPGALEVDVAFGAGFSSGAILRRMREKAPAG